MATNNPNALLKRLQQQPGEAEWLEFKQGNNDPDMIGRTVAALANAAILADRDRAFMVWGIEDKTKAKVGTHVRLGEMKKGGENFANWLARIIEPHLMMEFLDFEEDDKKFSILCIEPTYDRPVKFSGTAYVRIGENVRPLKDFPNHERALWMATGRRTFEDAVALPHQTAEDVLAKLDATTYYRLREEAVPANDEEIIRKLAHLDCIVDDMEGGFDITNLGAILFATDLSLFPSVNKKAIRLIKYSGADKRNSEEEIEGRKGYAVGFKGLLRFIIDKLPKRELYVDGVRRPSSVYSETAIREILANALIHQDLTITGATPVVEIYQDRIEVTNPGNSLIELDRIIDDRRSRNEKLAGVMRDMGICEERGGGIDKAILEVEEMGLPAPEFFLSENSMRAVIFGPKPFGQLSKAEKVWACFCHCVVRWLRHDYMSNTTLRERFGLPAEEYQAVSAIISAARQAGKIVEAEEGQGKRNARYVPYWAR